MRLNDANPPFLKSVKQSDMNNFRVSSELDLRDFLQVAFPHSIKLAIWWLTWLLAFLFVLLPLGLICSGY